MGLFLNALIGIGVALFVFNFDNKSKAGFILRFIGASLAIMGFLFK